ncbi:MAG: hypothetical protein HZA50_18455 [Planctomycetes bacterium]|nr:hypothetical protein [Planctomycetota bacterium]
MCSRGVSPLDDTTKTGNCHGRDGCGTHGQDARATPIRKGGDISGIFRPGRAAWIACVLLSPAMLCGCGWFCDLQNGYLLHGQDVILLPGQKVALKARLQSGGFLIDEQNRRVRFSLAGRQIAEATTDREGFAEAQFTPAEPGDYLISVEVQPEGLGRKPPPPAELLVACRKADQPIIVVDLDGTLVAHGFDKVLTGNPDPLPDSPGVMKRLADEFTILYLTHRPAYLGPKSKRWLAGHGFPRGPVILSQPGDLITGSGKYKTEQLEALHSRFSMVQIGIGDLPSDAQAYCRNKMIAYLIIDADRQNNALDIYILGKKLENLPSTVQIVFGWLDIAEGIFADKTFSAGSAIEKLKNMHSGHGRPSDHPRPADSETAPATNESQPLE